MAFFPPCAAYTSVSRQKLSMTYLVRQQTVPYQIIILFAINISFRAKGPLRPLSNLRKSGLENSPPEHSIRPILQNNKKPRDILTLYASLNMENLIHVKLNTHFLRFIIHLAL